MGNETVIRISRGPGAGIIGNQGEGAFSVGADGPVVSVDGGLPLPIGPGISARIARLLAGDWHAQQFDFAQSKVTQFTGWTPVPVGIDPNGTAATIVNSAGYEGGGLASTGSVTLQYLCKTLFNTPKTGRWAVAFDGQTGFPGVVTNTSFGVGNAAGTNFIDFGAFTAQSATNWVVRNNAGAVGLGSLGDVNRHVFFIIADGTNVTFYVDGAQNAQFPQSANITLDEPYAPFVIGDAGALKIARCGAAFV